MATKHSTEFISTSSRDLQLVDLVNDVFRQAVSRNYSDLHFESQDDGGMLIRAREDGSLVDLQTLDQTSANMLVEKVRARARLSNIEYREPQSGKFVQHLDGKRLNIRVSIINTDNTDVSIVLRVQDADNAGLSLDKIGMTPAQQKIFLSAAMEHEGLVLNTGPTGSGKSTTLFAGLQLRNQRESKLITIEDPIEYYLAGAVQIEVGTGTGKTFESVLREVLRQDPDVILVGEIRDAPSAIIASQAAQTGHIVFSTLHTNSAPEAVFRLSLLGVPDYIISTVMRLIIAQRLILKPCPDCQELRPIHRQEAEWFEKAHMDPPAHVVVNAGCDHCKGKGYKGRFPIFEMLLPSPDLLASINDPRAVWEAARAQPQFRTIGQSTLDAVRDLRASITEVTRLRVMDMLSTVPGAK